MNKYKIVVIFLALFSVAGILPLVQQFFAPIKLAGLQGAFDGGELPDLILSEYLEGDFQKKMDFYLQYNSAFNGELVRFRNQIHYDLFGSINTMLTLGKENYIYDPNYIAARSGENLISDSSNIELQKSVVRSINFLKEKNIPLLVVIPPNKANYYHEYLIENIPEGMNTNKKLISEVVLNNGGYIFDADSWFLELKNESLYPLVPKYGAHWSTYGAAIAGDSLLGQLSGILKKSCVRYSISELNASAEAQFTDDDYLPSLNLMRKWESPLLAYPTLEFHDGYKPRALIISDSYIWNWYDLDIIQNSFHDESLLLYYFKTVYDSDRNKIDPLDNNLSLKQILNYEIIIILNSDAGLPDFGYGFFQRLNKLMKNE